RTGGSLRRELTRSRGRCERLQAREGAPSRERSVTMAEFTETSIPAPGVMNVDFEERVDFGRLRSYRLGRAHDALARTELGSVLCFDMNNIRYVTSTNIGEWARTS